jgi:hydroxyacylglutathione hydrolase
MLSIKSFEFSPIQENTYILYNEFNDCVIIDPGCYYDAEKDELVAFITENKLKPLMLINTHCHLDHVFGNKMVAEKFGLTLQIHEKEKAVLAFAPTNGLMYEMPFDNYEGDFILLNEGDTIKMGEDELAILLTPGHSPGSLSFYSAANKFVLAGDVLFKNSVGRSDLPGGNHEQLIKSIKDKLLPLPNETIVYSGHGPATTIGEEKKYNPYLQ